MSINGKRAEELQAHVSCGVLGNYQNYWVKNVPVDRGEEVCTV